ncbi:hypothetical protein N7507_001991 [Penicillium longicatenatum]|nr:hypothetical protein N7507_001991 [Penicillium longicatenatum]
MNGFLSTENELRLTIERYQKYQGTAKININQIISHLSIARNLDRYNIERLYEVFNKEGYRRITIHYYISAVVSKQALHKALRVVGVKVAEMMAGLDRYPHLNISPDLQNSLIDEYSNKRVLSDGEIYRKV